MSSIKRISKGITTLVFFVCSWSCKNSALSTPRALQHFSRVISDWGEDRQAGCVSDAVISFARQLLQEKSSCSRRCEMPSTSDFLKAGFELSLQAVNYMILDSTPTNWDRRDPNIAFPERNRRGIRDRQQWRTIDMFRQETEHLTPHSIRLSPVPRISPTSLHHDKHEDFC